MLLARFIQTVHIYVNVWWRQEGDPLKSVSRLNVLMCAAMITLVVSGMFFAIPGNKEKGARFVVGLITSIIIIPAVFVCRNIITKADELRFLQVCDVPHTQREHKNHHCVSELASCDSINARPCQSHLADRHMP